MINVKYADIDRVRKKIEGYELRSKNLTLAMEMIAVEGYKDIIGHFRDEMGEGGQKWEKLKPETLKNRRKGKRSGVKILQDTGTLRNTLSSKVFSNEAHIFSNLKYAAAHNFGYAPKNIPQRKFLWIYKKRQETMIKIIIDYILGIIK